MRLPMLLLIFTKCIFTLDTSHSIMINKCTFPNESNLSEIEKFMKILSSIVGQKFLTEKDNYSYIVSICNDVSKDHALGTVIRKNKKEEVVVLGRRNDTQLIRGDNWIVLVSGSGDYITEKKNTLESRAASIYFVCNPDSTEKPQLQLVQEDGRHYHFIISTDCVCHLNEGISGVKVFLITLVFCFSLYCLIGVAYRKYVHRAQRCSQIPHFAFWSRIGNKLADCCNYVCRCDSEPEDSWNNITSNFDSGDRDDALLRP